MTAINALSLIPCSVLEFKLRTTSTSDKVQLTNPGGSDLVADGTINITDGIGFGAGLYDLITYTGVKTGPGFTLGTMPAGYNGTIIYNTGVIQLDVTEISASVSPSESSSVSPSSSISLSVSPSSSISPSESSSVSPSSSESPSESPSISASQSPSSSESPSESPSISPSISASQSPSSSESPSESSSVSPSSSISLSESASISASVSPSSSISPSVSPSVSPSSSISASVSPSLSASISSSYSPAPLFGKPQWVSGFPELSAVYDRKCDVRLKMDRDVTCYYVVVPPGSSAPTPEQIIDGRNASGVKLNKKQRGSVLLYKFTETTITIQYAISETGYNIYFASIDLDIGN